MTTPATRHELLAKLAELGLTTTTVDHPAVYTVEESQAHRGSIEGAHCKNLLLKDKKGRIFLVVAEEDALLDLKQLHAAVGGQGRVSFGSAELLFDVLGVTPGSVTPFGALNDHDGRVTVVLQHSLVARGLVNFHPLENTATTTLSSDDLVAFLRAVGHEPLIVDLPLASPGD